MLQTATLFGMLKVSETKIVSKYSKASNSLDKSFTQLNINA